MNRWIFGPLLGGALLATASYATAQSGRMPRDMGDRGDRGDGTMMGRFSPEDVEAFTDARIAALRAGLRLSPDQDKLWPAVEDAIRGLVTQRREQMREWRESRGQRNDDIPAMIRGMADRQAARADGLRKLADSAAPLYATFDDAQKRRLRILIRGLRPHGMMGRGGGMRGRGQDGGMRPWRDGPGR
jgi:zinc resistance-associated protein